MIMIESFVYESWESTIHEGYINQELFYDTVFDIWNTFKHTKNIRIPSNNIGNRQQTL